MVGRLIFAAAFVSLLGGCDSVRGSRAPLSMQVIVLNVAQLPDGNIWNDLVGRPIIAVEYETKPGLANGGKSLYLYDARTGECRTVIDAPTSPGDPMLIGWAPCK